jgi:hypothetical protein
MAIIPQISLFDFYEIEKLGDLERFKLALEGIDDEALMRHIEKMRGNGRDEYRACNVELIYRIKSI